MHGSIAGMEDSKTTDRKIEIIEATTELFLENGFSGTSMSAVAKACGITKATLYHHFPGKDDLFAACVTNGYAVAQDDLKCLVVRKDLSATEKLDQAMQRLYESSVSSPVGRMSPLIAEVSRTFPTVARAFHQDYIVPQRALSGQILDEGQQKGEFQEVDRDLFFHLVFGPIVTLSLSREMFATFDDLDRHFPLAQLNDGHRAMILSWLQGTAPQG